MVGMRISLEYTVRNEQSAEDLLSACKLAAELPWSPEATELVGLLESAVQGLDVRRTRHADQDGHQRPAGS